MTSGTIRPTRGRIAPVDRRSAVDRVALIGAIAHEAYEIAVDPTAADEMHGRGNLDELLKRISSECYHLFKHLQGDDRRDREVAWLVHVELRRRPPKRGRR